MRGTTSFLLGLGLGIGSVLLVQKLRKTLQEEDMTALTERVDRHLEELEARAGEFLQAPAEA